MAVNISALRAGPDTASRVFFQTLERDLKLSGWVMPTRSGGDFALAGSVAPRGGNLKATCQVNRIADRSVMLSKRYSLPANRARTLAHKVADEIIESITGRKGIASTKIAFVGKRTGSNRKELYLCDADGSNVKQLTKDNSIIVGPNWYPNGSGLLYTSFKRGFPDVYTHSLQSGRRNIVSRYGGLNTGASLSPDGKTMALILSKDGNPELYVQKLGGRPVRLTATGRATEASPSWSPDGQYIVYVSDQSGTPQLYKIARSGGRAQRLTRRGTENVAPDWGPNGLIACSSRSGGRYHIAIINPSTGETRYLPNDGADYEDPSWAPNGRHLVATRTVRYQSDLYLLDTVSDAPVALLKGGGNWVSPAWSPR